MLNEFHLSCITQQETVATFANTSICFPPPLTPPHFAESETSHRKQVAPGKGDRPSGWKRGTETEVMFGHPRLEREGTIMDAMLLSAFVLLLCWRFCGRKPNLPLFFIRRFSVCCPMGTKQVWGSGLLSPQHSGYVCLRSRCRPSSS